MVRIHSGVPHSKGLISGQAIGEYTTGTQQQRELSCRVAVLPALVNCFSVANKPVTRAEKASCRGELTWAANELGYGQRLRVFSSPCSLVSFFRISASSSTAALFTDSGMLC